MLATCLAKVTRAAGFSLFCSLFVLACGDDGDSTPASADAGADAGAGAEAGIAEAIQPTSETTCLTDVDCKSELFCFQKRCVSECETNADCQTGDTCSARKQCEKGQQDGVGTSASPATPEVVPGIGFSDLPWEVYRIKPGQSTVTITVKTTGSVPGGVIGYTIETYAHSTRAVSLPTKLFQAKGTNSFDLVIPTTAADPASDDPGIVEVEVATSVGSFRTKLQPQPNATGRYGGTVTVPRFGAIGLPIDFEIVTDPIDAAPGAAQHVYLVLPISNSNLYSPVSPAAALATAASVELTFQDLTGTWVGRTRSPYDFASDSMLGRFTTGSVIRGLRFELTIDDSLVTGTVRDSWDGLYDARTADGVTSAATVTFEGKLEARRLGAARALADLPTAAPQTGATVATLPLPDVKAACADAQFTVADVTVDGVTRSCSGSSITNADAFAAATPEAQASCATAVAETALRSGNTTAALISAFLSGDTNVTGSESFADFMTRCAAGTNGACRPTPAVLCGRALTARAIAAQGAPGSSFKSVYDAYTRATREAFLGRQLAAYQSDADVRLKWLKTQDYPAIITAAVRSLNEQLVEEWRQTVLDGHVSAIAGQSDLIGLTVLARQTQGQANNDARQLLLSEMAQSWRGAMDALTVATRRWNDIYQDTISRAKGAQFVASKAMELYVLGGVVDQLNVSAEASYASAPLAGGFSALLQELRQLALPFSALVYARDAEVVVSRSLNPLSTGDTVLSEVRQSALREIDRATSSVEGILARAKEIAVNEQLLRNDLNNQVDAAFDELVSLCGYPKGCTDSDREKPECWPRTAPGECGFGTEVKNTGTAAAPKLAVTVVNFTNTSNVSDAGEAILKVVEAEDALRGAEAALTEYGKVTDHLNASIETAQVYYQALADGAQRRIQRINKVYAEILEGLDNYDADVDVWFETLQTKRQAAIDERVAKAAKLKTIRKEGRETDIAMLRGATALSQSADNLTAIADRAESLTAIVAEGIPNAATDLGAPLKMALKLTTKSATVAMGATAVALDTAASIMEVERENKAQLNEEELANAELDIDLETDKRQTEIDKYQDYIDREEKQGATWEQRKRDIIAQLQLELETDLQLDRAYADLVERRDALFARVVEEEDRKLQRRQADLTVQQRQAEYLRVVQRAQLLDGRLRKLVAQRDQLNLNLGSPSVVFGWANQLEQAESRLDRAKDKLMDWVVALEYLAVRPFMDARLQILLARNTYQLSEIAGALDDIQARCGGAINTNTSTISLRDDVLRLRANLRDPATGTELTPAASFREVLSRASIPVDKRVRLSADATVGDLAKRSGVLALTFDLGLNDFANLASSCNAKIQDISVQLVGQGLGSGNPTVAVVYDGESSVRSCQPDISAIVSTIGPTATAFDEVTVFKAAGRVLAPVAGVNEFGSENQTLVGLPLASAYTVIIDPTVGENSAIKWSALEDIQLKVTYGYQDFFPKGQCY